jgi:hypothetical protein
MVNKVEPAQGRSITMLARRGRCQRLASLCAHFIMAQSRRSTREAADTFAVDLPPSPGSAQQRLAPRPYGRVGVVRMDADDVNVNDERSTMN